MSWINREPAEPQQLSDLEPALGQLRGRPTPCPAPDLLQAAQADVLPAEQRLEIIRHLQSCRLCQSLVKDLEAVDEGTLATAARKRIWQRVGAGIEAESTATKAEVSVASRRSYWRPLSLATVATAAVLVVFAVRWVQDRQHPASIVAKNGRAQVTSTPPPSVFRLDKAPVVLPASGVVVWRGQTDSSQRQIKALEEALAPYQSDNYAEAARRLEELRKKYPRMAEAPFYLGICQLFLNQNEAASKSLKDAVNLAEPPLSQAAAWYLALAFHRQGKDDLARPLLEAVCKTGQDYSSRGCAALKELGAQH